MTYIKISGKQYPAIISGRTRDSEWDERASKTINLAIDHAEASKIFVDGVAWSIIYQPEEGKTVSTGPVEYDNSDYCLAGDITDHRDGTVTVKMGKLTALEEAYIQLYGGDNNA